MNPDRNPLSWLLPALAAAIVVAVVGYVVIAKDHLPDGPTELVWDKTACDECQMHVGEPSFAAQAQTLDGRTLAYDDPGCLLRALADLEGRVHAIWFRHLHEQRWLRSDAVAFVAVEPTPMGYGVGAVDPGTPDSFPLEAARRRVTAIDSGR